MKRTVWTAVGTAVLLVTFVGAAAQQPPAAAPESGINPERIRAHVKFLSSDLLEGRGTGQRGGDLAAEYIATQFALDGLRPAGDAGSYLQKVPMVGIATQPTTTVALAPASGAATSLKLGDDVVVMDETGNQTSQVDADILYVGYGITAPEYQWNDYKDVEVRGKVLLMLVNEPPSEDPRFFAGKALTYYGRWTYKYEEAARRGAAGVLLVHKTDMASYGWDVVRNSWSGERAYLRGDAEPKLKLAAWVQLGIGNQLAQAAGTTIEKLMEQARSPQFRPIPIPVRVKARLVSHTRPFDSENVLGMVPGSDPKLKGEAVLYTAHFDHLGIHPEQPGDNIYNGAVDNATGCGILLEMARAYASAAHQPRRSVIFAAVTGEEQGLRGSEDLGKHPPVPAGKIALALNYDGLNPIGVPESLDVVGAERTSFYPVVERTAREFGFKLEPDANPGAGHYYRSDHFSLARVGVPAFSISQGRKFAGHPREWGDAQADAYRDQHYHQPSDEYRADWDFQGLAKLARFGVALGWQAADQAERVGWRPGDEFEGARQKATGR